MLFWTQNRIWHWIGNLIWPRIGAAHIARIASIPLRRAYVIEPCAWLESFPYVLLFFPIAKIRAHDAVKIDDGSDENDGSDHGDQSYGAMLRLCVT